MLPVAEVHAVEDVVPAELAADDRAAARLVDREGHELGADEDVAASPTLLDRAAPERAAGVRRSWRRPTNSATRRETGW